jgi:hypothetical protein
MRKGLFLVLVVLVLTGCPFMLPADGGVRASGVVRDAAGNPVAGAEVRLLASSRSKPEATGADGRFHVSELVAPGRYYVPLVISAAGFKSLHLSIPTLTNNHVVATLEALDSARESQATVHVLAEAPGSR